MEILPSVAAVYRLLLAELRDHPMELCRKLPFRLGVLLRADASASKEGIVRRGGWSLHERASTETARWFAVEISEATAPWGLQSRANPTA